MSWRVVVDNVTSTAVLVCDDPLYALGPVIEADSANEAFEAVAAFAEACDPPPDQQPTIRLMAEWQSYVQYLAGLQQQALTAAQGSPDGQLEPWSAEHATADEAAAAGDTTAQEAIAMSEMSDPTSESTNAGPPTGPAGNGVASGSEPIAGQQQVCWCCGGSGKLNLAGTQTDCNVCQGSGQVEAVAK